MRCSIHDFKLTLLFRRAGELVKTAEVSASTPQRKSAQQGIPGVSPRDQVSTAPQSLRFARSCYDHLAGRLGVDLCDAMMRIGVLSADFSLRDAEPLRRIGVDTEAGRNRIASRPCLDWSERRFHAAGYIPARLMRRMLDVEWLTRSRVPRQLVLTSSGRENLRESFGLDYRDLSV